MLLVGGGVGFVAAMYGIDFAKGTSLTQLLIIALLFIPAFFLVIAVHEGGHAIAGKWVNFEFRLYIVGPFMWEKEETGWVFKWNKNANVSGGLVVCLPRSTENLAKRFAIYALGGPTASLLLTALAWCLRLLIKATTTPDALFWKTMASFLGLLAFLSLIIFLATIIPMHTAGFYTDGARAIRFLRGGDTSRFELLLMKILTSSSAGMRPRSLDRAEIDEALELAQKTGAPTEVYVYYYLYQSALDAGEIEKAENYLDEYLKRINDIPEGFRGSVHLDTSFFYAFHKNDLEKAKHHWQQYVPSAVLPKAQVLATEAGILLLKNDKAATQEKISKALQELPNMMDRGIAITLREKLVEMQSRL